MITGSIGCGGVPDASDWIARQVLACSGEPVKSPG
jgi:hypothetical protein